MNGPIVILTHVHGLYPDRPWSGEVSVHLPAASSAPAARSSVQLQGDPHLFKTAADVVATEDGAVVGRTRSRRAARRRCAFRSSRRGRRCLVRFTVGRTRVPATVEPGSTDTRPLGAHFLRFAYHP